MPQPITVTEGWVPFRGYRTGTASSGSRWDSKQLPVSLLHGGPGIPSNCLDPLTALAATVCPVVFYDQLGRSNSGLPDGPERWSIGLYLDEVATVGGALGIGRVHVLGFSCGGTLALKFALTRPPDLANLILHVTAASSPLAEDATQRPYEALTGEVAETLRRHEHAEAIDHPEYQAARRVFDLRHVCRIDAGSDFLQRAIVEINPAIAKAMWDRDDRHSSSG